MSRSTEAPAASRRRTWAFVFVLVGSALNLLLLVLVISADRTWHNDFTAYYLAAQRMVDGVDLYAPEQLQGAYEAVDRTLYLYPPLLAQLLAPVTLVPLWLANALWVLASFAAAYAATWMAAGIGGARHSLERHLWCLAAVLLFPPVAMAAWQGNVSTLLGLVTVLVAGGGTVAGIAGAAGTLFKVAPIALVPAVLVHSRQSRIALLITTGVAVSIGLVLAPTDWTAFPTALRDMVDGGVGDAHNLAPDHVLASAALSSPLPELVRLGAVVCGLLLIGGSVAVARRHDGMPLAALLGTVAMLIIPGTLWYHYLAVLLPFAAMSWPRATSVERVALLTGACLVGSGLFAAGILPALAGTAVMIGAAGNVLRRRAAATVDSPRPAAVDDGGIQQRA